MQSWEPVSSSSWRSYIGRALSVPCYPALVPFAIFSHGDSTAATATWWRNRFPIIGLGVGALTHGLIWRRHEGNRSSLSHILGHVAGLLCFDHTFIWLTFIAHQLIEIFSVNRASNRLEAGKLHGPRVLVHGNGPSALSGEQLGHLIDEFDEVVRFNNFQTKVSGLEKWVGKKTTVHFSDGVLYPTYTEYHVPGASVVLSLFSDRFMVSGTYFILRGAADLQTWLTMKFLKDPMTTWLQKSQIERLKGLLGLIHVKHPTSGMLAIDYFLNKPGVQLPVVIHGFDFFQGPTIHYYAESEPLYERINNRIGVNQHSPLKEKVYVEKLVAEGKVCFLKDYAKQK